ncbi:MAG: cupin domain-containing protein, partial [Stellaceae bacterium]
MNDIARPPGLTPTIGGSTYVKPAEMEWKPTRFDKVSIKVLYEDRERGEMTCLLKLEPGAHIPFHKHPEIEQSLVLEGSVEDHDGVAVAGDYIWRIPGSQHENFSPNG